MRAIACRGSIAITRERNMRARPVVNKAHGIIGWGLNRPNDAERAFTSCYRCLRKGGHLIVGWNDLPENLPFRIDAVESLRRFRPIVFPPLESSEHLVENEWRHTFGFFCK